MELSLLEKKHKVCRSLIYFPSPGPLNKFLPWSLPLKQNFAHTRNMYSLYYVSKYIHEGTITLGP